MVKISKHSFNIAMKEFKEEVDRRHSFIDKLKSKYPESEDIIKDVENEVFGHNFNMFFINTINRLLEANYPCINNLSILEYFATMPECDLNKFANSINKGYVLKEKSIAPVEFSSYGDLYDYILTSANKEYPSPDFDL
jgi:hypothetical protein